MSHPAASQIITGLKNKNLVTSATCTEDGRKQLVQLTDSGKQLLAQIMPVWEAVTAAMDQLVASEPSCSELLSSITALENTFKRTSLAGLITDKIKTEVYEQ